MVQSFAALLYMAVSCENEYDVKEPDLIMRYIILVWVTIFLCIIPCESSEEDSTDAVVLITDFVYKMREGDSKEIAKALALFGAKKNAIESAAKYLSHKGLLGQYGKKQKEIYYLATEEIETTIIEQGINKDNKDYHIKIRVKVQNTDFIQAEIRNLQLDKEESNKSFRENMEQPVSADIKPAFELAKTYRLLRQEQWRMASIYLDHLEKKYPNWGEIYLAKAIVFYVIHRTSEMKKALQKACSLDNQEACNDLRILIEMNNKDLNLN